MSKTLPLTQGKVAIVDDEDYEWLNQYKWCAAKDDNTYYAVRATSRKLGKQKIVRMHREILGLVKGDGKQTDHRDSNGLNNRRYNIRICTNAQNSQNQRTVRKRTSRYKGVWWHKQKKKWHAQIQHNGRKIHLGYFANEIKAAKAYDRKAKELFGKFTNTNF